MITITEEREGQITIVYQQQNEEGNIEFTIQLELPNLPNVPRVTILEKISIQTRHVVIPDAKTKFMLHDILSFLSRRYGWPIETNLKPHPGFSVIEVYYNADFIDEQFLNTLVCGLFDGVSSAQTSVTLHPEEPVHPLEEDDEFPEEYITESNREEVWDEDPFELGEIVDAGDEESDE